MGASDFSKLPHIGESLLRKEDYRFLTGAGQYTDDIVLPNMHHAVFVRSPHAHANIRKIDKAAALKAPGVIGILDGNDVAAENVPINSDKNRLEWDLIPDIPTTRMNAAMVHLVNSKDGTLIRVNDEALYEIEAMASVVDLEVYSEFLEVGRQIHPTVDIKSDAGWIQLVHPDPEVFETDFQRIIELMPTLFEVEDETTPGSDQ